MTAVDINRTYRMSSIGELGPDSTTNTTHLLSWQFQEDANWILEPLQVIVRVTGSDYLPGTSLPLTLHHGYEDGAATVLGNGNTPVDYFPRQPGYGSLLLDRPPASGKLALKALVSSLDTMDTSSASLTYWSSRLKIGKGDVTVMDFAGMSVEQRGTTDAEWVALRMADGDPKSSVDVYMEATFRVEFWT